jgi:DUF1707 SHOCT-like domain
MPRVYHPGTVCYRRSQFGDEAWSRSRSTRRIAEGDRDLRASDADRDRVAEQLREHAGTGRLSVDELAERLETVFAARTLGELEPPLADLPRARRDHRLPMFAGAPLLGLAALLLMAWALTGAGSFWPIWVLLGLWWFGPLGRRHGWAHGRRGVL